MELGEFVDNASEVYIKETEVGGVGTGVWSVEWGSGCG